MYFVIVLGEESSDFDNHDKALEHARELMESGEHHEVYVAKATDKFTVSVDHEEVT